MIVVQFAGFSRSGKTEVCLRLAEHAAREGRLAYVKSHHAGLERPGSNTERMAQHAALRLLGGSDGMLRLGGRPTLAELLEEAQRAECDVVIVEGFKHTAGLKTWLRRDAKDVPPEGVVDVALDLTGTQALEMLPQELWSIAPRRTV
ncbi:MAG: molybdopterin-guanine dinucleotide biosynthesis protein MobB [Thermaerobacter sp.]|nr:molybdopterin-guanine dinucleotide biosynthesis protein MobB [Thermaerobacter sp.]